MKKMFILFFALILFSGAGNINAYSSRNFRRLKYAMREFVTYIKSSYLASSFSKSRWKSRVSRASSPRRLAKLLAFLEANFPQRYMKRSWRRRRISWRRNCMRTNSVKRTANLLKRFERYTKWRPFYRFYRNKRRGWVSRVNRVINSSSGYAYNRNNSSSSSRYSSGRNSSRYGNSGSRYSSGSSSSRYSSRGSSSSNPAIKKFKKNIRNLRSHPRGGGLKIDPRLTGTEFMSIIQPTRYDFQKLRLQLGYLRLYSNGTGILEINYMTLRKSMRMKLDPRQRRRLNFAWGVKVVKTASGAPVTLLILGFRDRSRTILYYNYNNYRRELGVIYYNPRTRRPANKIVVYKPKSQIIRDLNGSTGVRINNIYSKVYRTNRYTAQQKQFARMRMSGMMFSTMMNMQQQMHATNMNIISNF